MALSVNGANVYAGGFFTTISGKEHPYFAQFGEYTPSAIIPRTDKPATNSISVSANNFINSQGVIKYSLPHNAQVSIRIYDMRGRMIIPVVDRTQPAGNYSLPLSNRKLGTGLYLLRFRAGAFEKTQSIAIVR